MTLAASFGLISGILYPVSIAGFTGGTTVQRFFIDSYGDLTVAAITSDPILASNPNQNIVLFMDQSSNTWNWRKKLDGVIGD